MRKFKGYYVFSIAINKETTVYNFINQEHDVIKPFHSFFV